MNHPDTNFVKQYKPGIQARVELKNGQIVDVVNGRYFDAGTSVIVQGGKIGSMPSLEGEPTDITPEKQSGLSNQDSLKVEESI